jgi:hypothetical protein
MAFRRRRKSKVESVAEILARWLGKRERGGELHLCVLRNRWAEIVGRRVAEKTQPQALRDRILTVAVANSAWLNELSFMRGTILGQIQDLLPLKAVEGIRLVAGTIGPQPSMRFSPPVPPSRVELSSSQLEEIEEEVRQVEDPELREAIREARVAQLGRFLRFSRRE